MELLRPVLLVFLCVLLLCEGWEMDGVQGTHNKLHRPGKATYLSTNCWENPDGGGHDHAMYMMGDRTSFVFDVKACQNAILQIGPVWVKIGVNEYTYVSEDEMEDGGGWSVEEATSSILHCQEYRTFWIRWSEVDGVIELGRGPLLGEQALIMAPFTENIRKKFQTSAKNVRVKCRCSAVSCMTALWKIPQNTGESLRTGTHNTGLYSHLWKHISDSGDISFHVRACEDTSIHVLLSEQLGKKSPEYYEVSLTSSGTAQIQISGGDPRQKYGNTSLSCEHFTEFWISWYNDEVVFGRGPMINGDVMKRLKTGTLVDVRYLSIGSTGDATWAFEDSTETRHVFKSREQSLDDNCKPTQTPAARPHASYCSTWLEMRGDKKLYFSAATAGTAAIALTTIKRPNTIDYEVSIANGKTTIKQGSNVLTPASPVMDILSASEYRTFWIQWDSGIIRVGLGESYESHVLLEAKRPKSDRSLLNYVGFGFLDEEVVWKVDDSLGQTLTSYTYGSKDSDTHKSPLWRTSQNKQHITFHVQAVKGVGGCLVDGHVVLASSVGEMTEDPLMGGTHPYLDIELAHRAAGVRILQWHNLVMSELTPSFRDEDTEVLPDCSEARQLWISWSDIEISMGRGPLPSLESTFLVASHSMPTPITALSFDAKEEGQEIIWQLQEDSGDVIVSHLVGAAFAGPKSSWLYLGSVFDPAFYWTTFQVVACSDVNILLTSEIFENKEGVEIALRNNEGDESFIRTIQDGQKLASSTDISLSCVESKSFWVSWMDGVIKFGTGDTPSTDTTKLEALYRYVHNTALAYYPSVTYEATFIWQDNSALWGQFFDAGRSYNSSAEFRHLTMSVNHHQEVIFSVMACRNAELRLYEEVGQMQEPRYVITIGGDKNRKTSLRPHYDSNIVVSRDTPGILNCTGMRTFWLTWYTGQIRLGKGNVTGLSSILDLQELRAERISSVTFGSYSDEQFRTEDSVWELPLQTGTEYYGEPVPNDGMDSLSSSLAGTIIGVLLGLMLIIGAISGLMYMRRAGRLTCMEKSLPRKPSDVQPIET